MIRSRETLARPVAPSAVPMASAEDVNASTTLAGRLGGLALGAGNPRRRRRRGVHRRALWCTCSSGSCSTSHEGRAARGSSLPAVCRGIEDFSVRTEDGETIRGWYWAPMPGAKHADVTLLQLHGNAGSRHNRLYWAHHIRSRLGVGVALLDYRGYGGSTGSVTEKGMILDGVAGITWAATRARETNPVSASSEPSAARRVSPPPRGSGTTPGWTASSWRAA